MVSHTLSLMDSASIARAFALEVVTQNKEAGVFDREGGKFTHIEPGHMRSNHQATDPLKVLSIKAPSLTLISLCLLFCASLISYFERATVLVYLNLQGNFTFLGDEIFPAGEKKICNTKASFQGDCYN